MFNGELLQNAFYYDKVHKVIETNHMLEGSNTLALYLASVIHVCDNGA